MLKAFIYELKVYVLSINYTWICSFMNCCTLRDSTMEHGLKGRNQIAWLNYYRLISYLCSFWDNYLKSCNKCTLIHIYQCYSRSSLTVYLLMVSFREEYFFIFISQTKLSTFLIFSWSFAGEGSFFPTDFFLKDFNSLCQIIVEQSKKNSKATAPLNSV